jgi:pimeloyl-ACP methyl ester carboxylesterase
MKTILLIHGAWMAPASWAPWRAFFEAKGYHVLAPSWPYQDRPEKELQASSVAELARVGVAEILAHYEAIVRAQPEPPILIGHSFGGLFVQMLLDRGLGVAGWPSIPRLPRGCFLR